MTVAGPAADAVPSPGGPRVAPDPGSRRDLIKNAVSLFNATLLNSALGFAFWGLAARLLPSAAVGYGSAATSVMTLLGTIGMFGLGSLLIGELPRLASGRSALTSAATITCMAASGALGLAFVLIAPLTASSLRALVGGPLRGSLLVIGVALTAATLVLDQATIGVLRGGLQLRRNGIFALAKLVLLALAAALVTADGTWVVAAWVAGLAVSLAAMAFLVRREGTRLAVRPDWKRLHAMRRTAQAHNALNLAVQGPRLLLPVVVTVLVSSTANAGFYIGYMIITFLYIVPTHLSTVLFAVVAKDPAQLRSEIRFTLRLSYAIGAIGVPAVVLVAHPVLALFGRDYLPATFSLQLLAIGYLPMTIKLHYIAVSRAADRIGHAAIVMTAGAALELGGAAAGALLGGLNGLTAGYVIAIALEASAIGPTVLRAAISGTVSGGSSRSTREIGTPSRPPGTSRSAS